MVTRWWNAPGVFARADIDPPGFFDMLLLATIAKARWPGTTDERAAHWAVSFCRHCAVREGVINDMQSMLTQRHRESLSMFLARKACSRYAEYLNTPFPHSVLLENRT